MNADEQWFESDEFWEAMAPAMFTSVRWEAVPNDINGIESLTGLTRGAAVLDLCCGPGRHTLELARRGYKVTGVDRTKSYLQQVNEKARSESLDIELVQSDMRSFRRDKSYDLVMSFYTSFGYFEDPEDDSLVLRNMHASLKDGGCMVIETLGKERLAKVFMERNWQRLDDGSLLLEERTVTHDWSWIENTWILIKGGRMREFKVNHRLFSAAELKRLMLDCGFSRTACYGSPDGAAYNQNSIRMVVIGWK